MDCKYKPTSPTALNSDADLLASVLGHVPLVTDRYVPRDQLPALPVCCMFCPAWTMLEPLSMGAPTAINGAGWSTRNTLRCPTCAREYLLALDLTPTHNPAATVAKPRKTSLL